MLLDIAAINATFILAFFLRFDNEVPSYWMHMYANSFWAYSIITIVIFCYCALYERDWRYMTTRNIIRFGGAVFLGVIGYILFMYFFFQATFPRTVIVMQIILGTSIVASIRLVIHLTYFWQNKVLKHHKTRVLVIGAGDAGSSLVRDMLEKRNVPYLPIGYLDDDPKKLGKLIHSVEVLGKVDDVEKVVRQNGIELIIVAIPSAKSEFMQRIIKKCEVTGAQVKKVPSLFDILDGKLSINEIRNVDPEDILGRDPNINHHNEIAQYLCGKIIMVTGAGGSIGSELCRQILQYNPQQLILLDNSEFNLYTIDLELANTSDRKRCHLSVLADIQSESSMDGILGQYKPDIIFHAAAYKHVPLIEENVPAAVKNNIWGTKNLTVLAAKHQVKRFVMISTDKAVNPTNVMGASKRVAEMIVQSMAGDFATVFSAVRFGNVLNSNGSVLPLFKKQIENGGPVTVTHPDVVRYFMTIPEAVQLVLTSATMSSHGDIYVLEMGKPVRILDMARSLIKLSGFEPDKDIKIKFIGLRPGEKLYEELLTAEEGTLKTECDRIYIGKPTRVNRGELFKDVEDLWHLADQQKVAEILLKLKNLVPGFKIEDYIQRLIEQKPPLPYTDSCYPSSALQVIIEKTIKSSHPNPTR